MKVEKISFLKRMTLAITDFRMYPFTQKEKLRTAIIYFFKLLIFVSIILGAFLTFNIFNESPKFLEIYNDYMPDFKVTNGILKASENIEKEINKECYLIVNSDSGYNQINSLELSEEKDHDYYILVLSDVATVAMRTEDGIYELAGIQFEPNMNFDKVQVATIWEAANNSIVNKLIVWLIFSISIFIIMLIIRLWTLIMNIVSTYIINFMFGLKLKFIDALKVVLYASTLPLILEVIALIAVGGISETINFISVLVSCVYIFYALRALKLDSLILKGTGKSAEEKLKSALMHVQEELEKQLTELEKKEENENEKDENEKDEKKQAIEELSKELKEKEENLIKAQREYQEAIKKVMDIHNEKDK